MNANQRLVLIVAIIMITGMLAYPPFQIIANDGRVINSGYGWIFSPPQIAYLVATVNVQMLLLQWIGVLVIGGLAFLLAKYSSSVSSPLDRTAPTNNNSPNLSSIEGWVVFVVVLATTIGYVVGTETLLTIIVSIVVTWGLGLAPPLILRYTILKRPLNIWPSIAFCAAFWLINIFIFTALGSENRSHPALILIAYVSYRLLRRTEKLQPVG